MKLKYFLLNKTVLCIKTPTQDSSGHPFPTTGNFYTIRDVIAIPEIMFLFHEITQQPHEINGMQAELGFPKECFRLVPVTEQHEIVAAINALINGSGIALPYNN